MKKIAYVGIDYHIKLLSIAVRKGRVAAIMHVRKDSLKELRWLIEESRDRGIKMVYLSEVLEGQD